MAKAASSTISLPFSFAAPAIPPFFYEITCAKGQSGYFILSTLRCRMNLCGQPEKQAFFQRLLESLSCAARQYWYSMQYCA
jgi:hypothetical protein